jgi:hypothetical protein
VWFTIGCEQRQLLSVRVYPLGRARVHFARFVWSSKCGEFLMCQSSSLCNKSKVWYLNGRITCSPFFRNRVKILLIMFVHLFSGISGAFDNFALFFFGTSHSLCGVFGMNGDLIFGVHIEALKAILYQLVAP